MSGGKRAHRKARSRWWLIAFVLAVLVSLAVLWGPHLTLFGSDQGGDDRRRGITLQRQDTARSLLERCVADLRAADQAVAAAGPGIEHWRTHVAARTDMLAGEISEVTMHAIYERTRRKGVADHHRFTAALGSVEGSVPCEGLRSVNADSAGPSGPDCVARSQAAIEALAAARGAMADWQSHLHHMDEYDDGGMSTGTALHLWVKAWREAPGNISAFDVGRRALGHAPLCAGVTAP